MVDAIHDKGSYAYLQVVALGRIASPQWLERKGHPFIAPSPTVDPTFPAPTLPRTMTTDEIREFVGRYAAAASTAIHRAGFDGVEIHSANGCLAHQFLHEAANQRTDEYGGSIENRARFLLEVIEAVVKRVGAQKTGVRFSPWFDSKSCSSYML